VGVFLSHSFGFCQSVLDSAIDGDTLDSRLGSHRHIHTPFIWLMATKRHPSLTVDISCFPVGIDYVGYALGQTDTFQGTGVFSGIKMQRESSSSPPSSSTTTETAASSSEGTAAVSAEAVTAAGGAVTNGAETAKKPASTV
jgi:hypothetical protein